MTKHIQITPPFNQIEYSLWQKNVNVLSAKWTKKLDTDLHLFFEYIAQEIENA